MDFEQTRNAKKTNCNALMRRKSWPQGDFAIQEDDGKYARIKAYQPNFDPRKPAMRLSDEDLKAVDWYLDAG